MVKLKILAAILTIVALFILPSVSQAQPDVCRFRGSVTLDGTPVANGTTVKAWINSQLAEQVTTTGSDYVIVIDGAGNDYANKTVVFTVSAADTTAVESATYVKGDSTILNLNAITGAAPPGEPAITLNPSIGVSATNVCGENFLQNSIITITIGGETCVMTTSNASGAFCVSVAIPDSEPRDYTVTAADVLMRGASATFTLMAPEKGDPGESGVVGEKGETGDLGPHGPQGKAGSSVFGIVAIVVAILALLVGIVAHANTSRRWRRR